MNINSNTKILIAALDWGLGHASRMIPVIEHFVDLGSEVAFASSGSAFLLLKNRFPELKSFELPSYNISYRHKSMFWEMLRQLPKILIVRRKENSELKKILKEYKADLIISDNRYGFYNVNVPSVFVTHQIQILAPKSLSFLNPFLKKIHLGLLSKFQQIWVPDFYGDNSLAGKLSNIENPPIKVKYIGPLSRFDKVNITAKDDHKKVKSILVILSGPEPARTNFENILLPQLESFGGQSFILRGLPADKESININRVEAFNHLEDKELLPLIEKVDLIISRSGYSTIMDMYFLKKKCIFIPTKGQTEQEYLSQRFMEKGIVQSISESEFDLKTALNEVHRIEGFTENNGTSFYQLNLCLKELGFTI